MHTGYNITVVQGSSYSLRITAVDANGDARDLTNYTTSGFVRDRYSSTGVLLYLRPVIHPSFVSGFIDVFISGSETAGLPVAQKVYDVEIYNSGTSHIAKAARGYFNIEPEVTR